MNKAEFLERLDSRIAVLTESERKDILDEYAQHIDMKMAENLSEQEAIEEFGDMDDWRRISWRPITCGPISEDRKNRSGSAWPGRSSPFGLRRGKPP